MVDFDDIQALARFGHGQLKDSHFLLLEVRNKSLAGAWLKQAAVSSAASQQPVPNTAMQIAFTAAGLRALGLTRETVDQFSEEFLNGLASDENRSRRLGDTGMSSPQHWLWGAESNGSIHLLLLLYAREGHLADFVNHICNVEFAQAFLTIYTVPTNTLSPREPFGFLDGISQPAIDWQQDQRTDVHARESYSNLLAPGEVVLGYTNEYGQYTHSPVISSSDEHEQLLPLSETNREQRDFGKNGSYLVLRQLEQDVSGFWNYIYNQSGDDQLVADKLAATLVGRHRNGDSLVPPTECPISGISPASTNNHFNFDADAEGFLCPVGAHIRRSNPRTGDFPPGVSGFWKRLIRLLGFKRRTEYEDLIASTRFHRILRRGRTYGSPSPDEFKGAIGLSESVNSEATGLQFMCLVGNILRQFEFVQSAWSESSSFAGLRDQRDPILGSRQSLLNQTSTDLFIDPDPQGAPRKLTDIPRFVTVRGGAYFFMPGLRAIRYLGSIASSHR